MRSSKKIDKIRPETLLQLVRVVLDSSPDFKYISGYQPFLMIFGEQPYYVYIKNISSAYFEDRGDTTRAQLPMRPEFDEIKQSSYPFIFLGYDSENDVLICWNYHIAKKRLNAASSVSFYSRTDFQEEVRQGEFLRKTLKNGDTPVLFKRRDIIEFFKRIDSFFINENNHLYCQYKGNYNYQKAFEGYIFSKGLSESTCYKYSKALEGKISDGISRFITNETTNIFYYDKIQLLKNWLEQLFSTPEYEKLDIKGKHMYSCAFDKYIHFHTDLSNGSIILDNLLNDDNVVEKDDFIKQEDYESDLPIVVNGKLIRIVDEDLLAEIMPLVMSNRNLSAAQIVGKYYAGKYPKMRLVDWMDLVKGLIKNDLHSQEKPLTTKHGIDVKKKKLFILRVTLPDGSMIEEREVSQTLVKVVEYAGVLNVKNIGIKVNNVNLLSENTLTIYERAQKPVGNGLYITTSCDTDTKQRIIQQISDSLNMGLIVTKVPISE